tara:strand:+ start:1068 stop:1427 length:360 start_codon:yes stop_codon:yes gene_type:complete
MDYNQKAFIIGMIGDFFLQQIVNYHPKGDFAGLKSYFEIHGVFESLLIAGGMMYFFGILFDLTKQPKTFFNLAIYGTILDILFRQFRLFPSLDGYYNALTPFQSIIWAVIPINLPLLFN